jgi:hypothetical protein
MVAIFWLVGNGILQSIEENEILIQRLTNKFDASPVKIKASGQLVPCLHLYRVPSEYESGHQLHCTLEVCQMGISIY